MGGSMKETIKLELKKAFQNKFFWISIAIGILITFFSFFYNIKLYLDYRVDVETFMESQNPMTEMFTAFNTWIGGEPFSLGTSIYFFVFPILIAIPYGWSYAEECRNGYRRMMIVRTGKKAYYFAKYVAVFLSGGVAMILPLLINFWMTLLIVPSICPNAEYSIYNAVFGGGFLSGLYYTVPFLFAGIYFLIDFLWCGCLACVSMAVSGWIRQKWVSVLIPFLLLLVWDVGTKYIYSYVKGFHNELSPLYFLRYAEARYSPSGFIILLTGFFVFLVTVIGVLREYQNEIY